jgi:hypothetical protein
MKQRWRSNIANGSHRSAHLNFGTLTVAIGAALLALALAEENLGFGKFDLGTVFIAG